MKNRVACILFACGVVGFVTLPLLSHAGVAPSSTIQTADSVPIIGPTVEPVLSTTPIEKLEIKEGEMSRKPFDDTVDQGVTMTESTAEELPYIRVLDDRPLEIVDIKLVHDGTFVYYKTIENTRPVFNIFNVTHDARGLLPIVEDINFPVRLAIDGSAGTYCFATHRMAYNYPVRLLVDTFGPDFIAGGQYASHYAFDTSMTKWMGFDASCGKVDVLLIYAAYRVRSMRPFVYELVVPPPPVVEPPISFFDDLLEWQYVHTGTRGIDLESRAAVIQTDAGLTSNTDDGLTIKTWVTTDDPQATGVYLFKQGDSYGRRVEGAGPEMAFSTISGDGRYLVYASDDGPRGPGVYLHEIASGEKLKVNNLNAQTDQWPGIAIAPFSGVANQNKYRIVYVSDGFLYVADVVDGVVRFRKVLDEAGDSDLYAISGDGGTVVLAKIADKWNRAHLTLYDVPDMLHNFKGYEVKMN